MNEERKIILEMLKNGTVTVEEADKLLSFIPSEAEPNVQPQAMPKRLHIIVTQNGQSKANIKIPFSLVKAALKMGRAVSGFSINLTGSESDKQVMETLRNIDFDALMAEIADGEITLPYTFFDASEADGTQVQIVLE